jgi:2-polyprenyl-6-methoxyphenol hydroxylase-like FAD-dependent oxidoreductase
MKQPIKTVAVLGAGPAASALATLLVRGGIRVALLRFLMKYGLKDEDPQAMAIR